MSTKTGENSPNQRERAVYCAASDVAEMKSMCGEIVALRGNPRREKERVNLLVAALRHPDLTWNRCFEFLKGKSRRVDGWEKDLARDAVRRLREAQERQRANEHLAWLQEQIERARQGDEEFRGAHVDGLEHFLRGARGDAGAVEVRDEALK